MENRAHAIIAICFLAVFTLVAVLIFWWLSSGPAEPRAYRIITGDSVAGLALHANVTFKGIAVGHVTGIRFDPHNRAQVIIDFRVRRDTYITHATYAELAMQGLTGGDVLALKLGTGSAATLATSHAHPALIPLRKGLLAQLEASATNDMQELHSVLADAKQLLGSGNRAHLAATIRQLDAATAKLVELESHLQPVVRKMPALMASAQRSLDESHALIANASQLAKAARAPVAQAGTVVAQYGQLGRTLTAQTAPDLDALAQSLNQTSRQLEQLLRELRAKPQSVIFGPPARPPGPGEPGFHAHRKDNGHD